MTNQSGGEAFAEDDERQMLDAIGRWLEREVRPRVLELEHADEYPRAMVEQMREFGLFGATIAPAYGGLGMPTSPMPASSRACRKSGCRCPGCSART
jgi:alkylation response protein AidB-like acyl-CoA dehydrogenase